MVDDTRTQFGGGQVLEESDIKEILNELRNLIQGNAISDLNHYEANDKRIEKIENNIDYARFEIQEQRIEILEKKLLNIESVHDIFVDVMDKQTKFEEFLKEMK